MKRRLFLARTATAALLATIGGTQGLRAEPPEETVVRKPKKKTTKPTNKRECVKLRARLRSRDIKLERLFDERQGLTRLQEMFREQSNRWKKELRKLEKERKPLAALAKKGYTRYYEDQYGKLIGTYAPSLITTRPLKRDLKSYDRDISSAKNQILGYKSQLESIPGDRRRLSTDIRQIKVEMRSIIKNLKRLKCDYKNPINLNRAR